MGKLILGETVLGGGGEQIAIQTAEPENNKVQVWITPTDDNTKSIVEEAPIDGNLYGRKSGTWKKVNIPNLVSELDSTEKETIKTELGLINTVEEAPKDSNYYARKNGTWVNTSLNALAANTDAAGLSTFMETIGAAESCQVVNHGTSDTTLALSPNKYHIWGEVSSLNLTLPSTATTSLKVYAFQFTSGSTATTLNIEGLIGWMVEDFEIEANKVYQCTIMNGYGAIGGIAL